MKRRDPVTPKGETIGELIRSTGGILVPDYQRRYNWGNDQVTQLWNDICEQVLVMKGREPHNGVHYFGNSIIYEDTTKTYRKHLVDGQQRTLTFLALVAAFRDFYKQHGAAMSAAYVEACNLLWDRRSKASNVRSDNHLDNLALQQMLEPSFVCNAMGPGLARLHKSYHWFTELIEKAYEEEAAYDPVNALTTTDEWLEQILAYCHVSTITSDEMEEALIMFKSMNTTGLDLDGSDVVKVFLRQDALKHGMIDDFKVLWTQIEADCKEKPQHIGFMLGDYWKTRTSNLITSRGIVHHWQHFLKKEITTKTKYTRLLQQLTRFSNEWGNYFHAITDNHQHNDLVDMRVSNQLAPILAAHYAKHGSRVVKGPRKDLYNYVEYLHLHAKLAGNIDSNALKKVYVRWGNLAYKNNFATALDEMKKEAQTHKVATRPMFVNNLVHTDNLSRAQARFMLKKVEMIKNPSADPKNLNDVEHICPQTLSPDWAHIKWDDFNNKTHNLGNLTLLEGKLNKSVSNKGWATKLPEYKKSNLHLVKDIVASAPATWDEKAIEKRCKELAGFLFDRFTI